MDTIVEKKIWHPSNDTEARKSACIIQEQQKWRHTNRAGLTDTRVEVLLFLMG